MSTRPSPSPPCCPSPPPLGRTLLRSCIHAQEQEQTHQLQQDHWQKGCPPPHPHPHPLPHPCKAQTGAPTPQSRHHTPAILPTQPTPHRPTPPSPSSILSRNRNRNRKAHLPRQTRPTPPSSRRRRRRRRRRSPPPTTTCSPPPPHYSPASPCPAWGS
ncbi:hypothetical protein CALCODRAFT_497384 [Calocera cornea HHB12733]|uniref:Uncharacterized protein n=1 Tax=Calocera cornea HHB12733 TaxID=1353952 RepID=A0A165FAG7_9BASI|nr:hypothetical protein CALCODRAFT_497384 [Calocera cornea HHB12733]